MRRAADPAVVSLAIAAIIADKQLAAADDTLQLEDVESHELLDDVYVISTSLILPRVNTAQTMSV